MRLFVAVHPPEPVLDQIADVAAGLSGIDGLRPTRREQWHVTLRFLGEVEDPGPVVKVLDELDVGAAEARLGPTVSMIGRQVLCIPVAGLDTLAAAVSAATAAIGQPLEDRPFHGHLTLARLKRGRRPRDVRAVVGTPIAATWTANDFALVRSQVSSAGSVYEDLHTWPLLS